MAEKAVEAGCSFTTFVHDGSHAGRFGVTTVAALLAIRRQCAAIDGQDAVIDTVGGKTPYEEIELEWTAAKNIVDAMQAEGVRRLIVVSMMGIGESSEQAPVWNQYLLMPTLLRKLIEDTAAMEGEAKARELGFVNRAAPIATQDAATGSAIIVPAGAKGHKITRADPAKFLGRSTHQP